MTDFLQVASAVFETVEAWRGEKPESFTGYEGLVRVGPRRGFHLLLVEETDAGFVPISLS